MCFRGRAASPVAVTTCTSASKGHKDENVGSTHTYQFSSKLTADELCIAGFALHPELFEQATPCTRTLAHAWRERPGQVAYQNHIQMPVGLERPTAFAGACHAGGAQ